MERLVVIGAGPAGLATAGVARRLGVEPLLVDRAAVVGGAWARMRPDMRCLSPYRFDRMPDGSTPQASDDRATAAEVLRWLQDYAGREQFTFMARSEVTAMRQVGAEFQLDVRRPLSAHASATKAGAEGSPAYPIGARAVVVATGEFDRPIIPQLAGQFDGPTGHSASLDISAITEGERVLVVGAGNSAAEIVPLLLGRGAVVIVAARRPLRRPAGVLRGWLADLQFQVSSARVGEGSLVPCDRRTPPVDDVLRPLVKSKRIALVGEAETLRSDAVACGGEWVACDRIVWATGFARATTFAPPAVLDGDWPLHDSGVSTQWPNLGFVGVPCQRTRRSGFLRGFVGDAQAVLEQLL